MQRVNHFKKYIDAFEKKLEAVVIDDISTKEYCKRYLAHLLQHKKYYLAIYADVLENLVHHSAKSKEDISLLDLGSGNGLLGIFAKFCGFKKIFLNDIDPRFVSSSEKLAGQLGIKIDAFICGNINEVRSYFKNEVPDAVIGTDVIEHIYDLENLFQNITQMNPSMVSVFTTASNPANFFKVRELEKIQLKDELQGGSPDDHILFGEKPLEPFLKTREKIIREHTQGLSEVEIPVLAKATRGLNKNDILLAIKQYQRSGVYPVPAHKTNTCNPLNGSWTERILSFVEYISIYKQSGFTCTFYAGFYNDLEGTPIVRFVKKMLNAGITTLGKKISPYIVIVGKKNI